MYNKLAVAIVVVTGIMLATSGSAAVVYRLHDILLQLLHRCQETRTAIRRMKSGNITPPGGMMNKTGSDNMSKADNTKASTNTHE